MCQSASAALYTTYYYYEEEEEKKEEVVITLTSLLAVNCRCTSTSGTPSMVLHTSVSNFEVYCALFNPRSKYRLLWL